MQRKVTGRIGTLPVEPSPRMQPGPKPNPQDTPYRSAIYVAPSHSADGNGYALGEPVPEIEYQRQVDEGIIEQPVEPVKARHICPKCKGTGRRAYFPKHKFGCGCVACSPCKGCGGKGRLEA